MDFDLQFFLKYCAGIELTGVVDIGKSQPCFPYSKTGLDF
jgi:hypothetical protein